MRKRVRVDANQFAILQELRARGVSAFPITVKGAGDVVAGHRGVNYLLEIKNGNEMLTPAEATFKRTWAGQHAVVRSVEEALAAVGITQRR